MSEGTDGTGAQALSAPETMSPARRVFLKNALTGAAALTLASSASKAGLPAQAAAVASGAQFGTQSGAAAVQLAIVRRILEVNGRAASVYGIHQPDGTPGIRVRAGGAFSVNLKNTLAEPTSVHWHGLTPPWPSDGVPGAPLPALAPGASRAFDFPVREAGTYWMHAHTLQEQQLLAAPLIVTERATARRDEQDVVMLLHDFSFRSPQALLAGLTNPRGKKGVPGARSGRVAARRVSGAPGTSGAPGAMHGMADMPGMEDMPGMDMPDMPGMHNASDTPARTQPPRRASAHKGAGADMAAMAMDLNDIDYDAYLANDRTLDDPDVIPVERGAWVRVRVINAAAATAFTIDFGVLPGTLIAVDGRPVAPLAGRRFALSMGQRIDVRVRVPAAPGAFPILALREGAPERAGIVLRTGGAKLAKIPVRGALAGPVLDLALESRLRALAPLPARRVRQTFRMTLTGDMRTYRWALPTQPRLVVDPGERVELIFRNASMMAHPMHLHGHRFQVVAIDGQRFQGAVRDTVLVPPMRAVTVAVDADNAGQWALHCHHLYHMVAGMMTTFAYRA